MTGLTGLRGLPGAAGVATGPWTSVALAPLPAAGRIESSQIPDELARVRAAIEGVARDLDALAERVRSGGHETEAAIFAAQVEMARDPGLEEGVREQMATNGLDAIGAVQAAAASIAEMLASLDNELLAARATDVRDVGERIARTLAGLPTAATLVVPAIVVDDDLSPAMTATLPRDRLLGIVLAGSSVTAHAVILARAYGIPAIVGAREAVAAIRAAGPEATLAIDGSSGEIVIDPDQAEAARFEALATAARADRDRDLRESGEPATTTDGVAIALLANIGTPDEAAPAVALGARGVGLFRTEFLFLERSAPPTEDEQVAAYQRVVEAFGGNPVTIRLLDIGGDKPIPYLSLPPEENPFLGVRALRLAETRPDLFLTQLRACYRAAASGPVKVMAPMVADAGDVDVLLQLAARARAEAVAAGHPVGDVDLGVMLEIPSAVLTADAYAERIAFASLGTNDLLQYTLAADRGNPGVERYQDPLHPALLALVRAAVVAADRATIELSVCGEMAG
ncbi:MAG TPA: phosphoenolpyruvate--protein phosphotransferase, partial [Candidatus Limnocylindrales bacterium]|nr:phosphoenolpyruvate--protein phosphotransferase [Candidatus Limnocylindrales bacterium]